MPTLKTDLPREQFDAVQALEARAWADECWRALDLVRHPSNVAVWALLSEAKSQNVSCTDPACG